MGRKIIWIEKLYGYKIFTLFFKSNKIMLVPVTTRKLLNSQLVR